MGKIPPKSEIMIGLIIDVLSFKGLIHCCANAQRDLSCNSFYSHMFSSFEYDQIEELIWDKQDQAIDSIREDILSECHDLGPMDLIELGL